MGYARDIRGPLSPPHPSTKQVPLRMTHKVKGVVEHTFLFTMAPTICGRPVFEGSANCWLGLGANRANRELGKYLRDCSGLWMLTFLSDIPLFLAN